MLAADVINIIGLLTLYHVYYCFILKFGYPDGCIVFYLITNQDSYYHAKYNSYEVLCKLQFWASLTLILNVEWLADKNAVEFILKATKT